MNFIFRSRLCSRLLAFCSQPNTPRADSRKLFKMWKREAAKKQKLLSLLFAHFAMLLLSALKTTLSSVLLLFPCSLYCRLRMQCHGEFHYGSHSRAEHESKARKIFNVFNFSTSSSSSTWLSLSSPSRALFTQLTMLRKCFSDTFNYHENGNWKTGNEWREEARAKRVNNFQILVSEQTKTQQKQLRKKENKPLLGLLLMGWSR